MRLHQGYLLVTLEMCLALFASATWHVGYLARHPVFLLVFTAAIVNRVQHGDDVQPYQNWILTFCMTSAVELSLYLNMKAKVKLFLEIKIVE